MDYVEKERLEWIRKVYYTFEDDSRATKSLPVGSLKFSILGVGVRGRIKGGGREEKGKISPFLYSKPPFYYHLWSKNNEWLQQVRTRKEEFLKQDWYKCTGAHGENCLVTSFRITGLRISVHLTYLRGQRLWWKQARMHLSTGPVSSGPCLFLCRWENSLATLRGEVGNATASAAGWRVAVRHRRWEGDQRELPFDWTETEPPAFLLQVSRRDSTESVGESLGHLCCLRGPNVHQEKLRLWLAQANPGDPALRAYVLRHSLSQAHSPDDRLLKQTYICLVTLSYLIDTL